MPGGSFVARIGRTYGRADPGRLLRNGCHKQAFVWCGKTTANNITVRNISKYLQSIDFCRNFAGVSHPTSAIPVERVVEDKEEGGKWSLVGRVSVTRDVFWEAIPAERMAASSTYTSEVVRGYRRAARLL